jgi:hypothetical protein
MRSLLLAGLCVLAPAPLCAQQAVLFVGRFPFVSLDDGNERPGGSITRLEEFDVSFVTPGPGAVARTFWLTTTTHQTLMGDAYGDANYTRFAGFKTRLEEFNFCGPFVKFADRTRADWDRVYWTVRDAVNKQFRALHANGTQVVTIQPGDFFRFAKNGNVELFITQALIDRARGPDQGPAAKGADCICQDAQRNLYYSPAQGGHYVSGNTGAPVFYNDGGIVMIRAQDIAYDGAGNVQDVVPSSAFAIFGETEQGPSGQPTVRTLRSNSGARDNSGGPMPTMGNMVGLALDPNGGTITASLPRVGNVFETVPNFVFTDDVDTMAATVFSTRVNTGNGMPGSIAVINGVRFGDSQAAATGAWLGVKRDLPNGAPTMMGFCIVDAPQVEPFVADAPNHGAVARAEPTIYLDFWSGTTPTFVSVLIGLGPTAPGQFPVGFDLGWLLGPDSFRCGFGLVPQLASLPIGPSNPFGYSSLQFSNPQDPALAGTTLLVHGFKLTTTIPNFALSSPCLLQLK